MERFSGFSRRGIVAKYEPSESMAYAGDRTYFFPDEFQEWLDGLQEKHDFTIEEHLGGGCYGDAFLIRYKGDPNYVLKFTEDLSEAFCIEKIFREQLWETETIFPEIIEAGSLAGSNLWYEGLWYSQLTEKEPEFWYIRKAYLKASNFREIAKAFKKHFGLDFSSPSKMGQGIREEMGVGDAHPQNIGFDPDDQHPVVYDPGEC